MQALFDADIDTSPLESRKIAILGFGNQGRAQALNLQDGRHDVIVGLRAGSKSIAEARSAGLDVAGVEDAVAAADLIMFLVPDEIIPLLYREIEGALRPGAAIGFSHGLAVHFGLLAPRDDLDVILVAPKGPGTALRSLYMHGKGMIGLWAVAQDRSGTAERLALAYGQAIGCGRAGLIRSSFAEECEADLFNENAVVWGAVPEILEAGFDTLVAAGIAPEIAYMECVGELKLLAELIEARGIAGMREAISNTAELGATLGGPQVVDPAIRQRMAALLQDIRSGGFATALQEEFRAGYPVLRSARKKARAAALEQAFKSLRDLPRGA